MRYLYFYGGILAIILLSTETFAKPIEPPPSQLVRTAGSSYPRHAHPIISADSAIYTSPTDPAAPMASADLADSAASLISSRPETAASPIAPASHVASSVPALSSKTAPALLAPLLNIPYRQDGTATDTGEYTVFASPQKRFATPGLNCSGFVVAACRVLFHMDTAQATADRLGDSGSGSPYGADWDYGWDLVCNLSEGRHPRFLLPDGTSLDPASLNGITARGYDLHAPGQLDALLARMRSDHLYLVSFNKLDTKTAAVPLHYHVALMLLDGDGQPLLYQTTTQHAKSYVRNLASPRERLQFLKAFANTKSGKKHLAVIEIPM